MDAIKVNTRRVDETVHHVVLTDAQLRAMVAEAVSKAAGVSIDGRAVRLKQCYLSGQMGSTGSEYSATCTITIDHQVQPVIERPG
jgi:hypothetical protein